jgi:hypothetical protein
MYMHKLDLKNGLEIESLNYLDLVQEKKIFKGKKS